MYNGCNNSGTLQLQTLMCVICGVSGGITVHRKETQNKIITGHMLEMTKDHRSAYS